MGIPKIIHYCWFGNNKMPNWQIKNIHKWEKICKGYKFIKWSEDNFDVYKQPFTAEAYKKHDWAFVSDYVRLYALKKMGGIYLDTDVEILKSLTPLLYNKSFIGLQDWDSIASGLIYGAEPNDVNVVNIMKVYSHLLQRYDGHINPIMCNTVTVITNYFRKLGFKYKNRLQNVNGCTIYPTNYFCPQKFGSNKICITDNTYTIHHYYGSWINQTSSLKKRNIHIKEGQLIKHLIGRYLFIHLYNLYYKFKSYRHD